MTDPLPPSRPGKAALWTGRILSTLVCLWMIALPIGFVIFAPDIPKKGMTDAGFSAEQAIPINIICATFAILFAIPRTAVFGALFLTAYLGAAAAVHIRGHDYAGTSLPIIFAALIWSSLLLREPRLRALIPLRRRA